jgi:DNA-directed RNA polymerase subunit M/transcription elongation factor TFIIS
MSRKYSVGQRVLIVDPDGNLWAAKIHSPEVEGTTLIDSSNYLVKYYGFDEFYESSEIGMEVYEGNPKVDKLEQSIRQAAESDDLALRKAQKSDASRVVPKRQRTTEKSKNEAKKKEHKPEQPERQEIEEPIGELIADSELLELANHLTESVQKSDVSKARTVLLALVKANLSLPLLQKIPVGKTVASIVELPQFKDVAGLARLAVRKWVRLLPEVTRNAVRSHITSATAGATAQKPTPVAQQNLRSHHFSQTLRDALAQGCEAELIENIEMVAAALEQFAQSRDDRQKLIEVLGNREHTEIRHSLLTGSLSPSNFFHLRGENLLTPKEREKRQEDLQTKLNEQAQASEIALSDMYECPKCHVKKVTYYQQQTRGGDEPMTVFVKCHACKWEWTQE